MWAGRVELGLFFNMFASVSGIVFLFGDRLHKYPSPSRRNISGPGFSLGSRPLQPFAYFKKSTGFPFCVSKSDNRIGQK